MRWRLRTPMVIVALLALAFASPDPVMAFTLIFTCPLWFPVILFNLRARAPVTG
jgi:hypothetical protein